MQRRQLQELEMPLKRAGQQCGCGETVCYAVASVPGSARSHRDGVP